MLVKYRSAVDSFSSAATQEMRRAFRLPGLLPLFDELHERGYGQADLCLELLHTNLLPEVEALIGRPIVRGPPPITGYVPGPCEHRERGPDDRRVTHVARNPRLPTTPAFQRFREFRPGVTISSLLRRGVTRRDIREAVSNDWVAFA